MNCETADRARGCLNLEFFSFRFLSTFNFQFPGFGLGIRVNSCPFVFA